MKFITNIILTKCICWNRELGYVDFSRLPLEFELPWWCFCRTRNITVKTYKKLLFSSSNLLLFFLINFTSHLCNISFCAVKVKKDIVELVTRTHHKRKELSSFSFLRSWWYELKYFSVNPSQKKLTDETDGRNLYFCQSSA